MWGTDTHGVKNSCLSVCFSLVKNIMYRGSMVTNKNQQLRGNADSSESYDNNVLRLHETLQST